MDLLEPDLVRRWRRKQRDRVKFEIAERYGVELERVFVVEVGHRRDANFSCAAT